MQARANQKCSFISKNALENQKLTKKTFEISSTIEKHVFKFQRVALQIQEILVFQRNQEEMTTYIALAHGTPFYTDFQEARFRNVY